MKSAPEEVLPLHRRATELRQQLKFWSRGDDRSFVYWIERRGRGCFLQATPIDVSSILEEKLFDAMDTVILTSATLAVGGTFEFAEKRLGIRHTRSLVVPSHFDYQKQALLYVPQHMPDPRTPGVPQSRRRRGHAHPEAHARAGVRPVHQLPADAHGLRSRVARDRLSRRCCKAPDRAARCWTNFAARRTACCSRRPRSGRAWTCRAIS